MFSAPVLIPGFQSHTWLTSEGEVLQLDGREAGLKVRSEMPLVCHGPAVARRIHQEKLCAADVLSLFAFVRPARWCVPTPAGLAAAMGLSVPETGEDQAMALLEVTHMLIQEVATKAGQPKIAELLWLANRAGWPFAMPCLQALGQRGMAARQGDTSALKIWRRLSTWEDSAPPGRPGNLPITADEAQGVLDTILNAPGAEDRPEQRAYARGVAAAFAPAQEEAAPTLVLAEAGTGVGKTLGYLAPAYAWGKKNNGPIWLSTYTRNLQRQLDEELTKLYPNPAIKDQRVVVRKGRENYLCLLNMEEVTNSYLTANSAMPNASDGASASGRAPHGAVPPASTGGPSALPQQGVRNSYLTANSAMPNASDGASASGRAPHGAVPPASTGGPSALPQQGVRNSYLTANSAMPNASDGASASGRAPHGAVPPASTGGPSALPQQARKTDNHLLGLILMTRWVEASRAGELMGGDCPGWLRELVGLRLSHELAVRRGECWHGACPHYGACFAEKVARKAPHAEVVVANHAFVMTQTLADPFADEARPTHFVFDEGHHLFDAADSAFGAALSGVETRDLRRWILGAERTQPGLFAGRARGLRKRLEDLADSDTDLNDALHAVERAAQILPATNWYDRLKNGQPKGPVEAFLAGVATQVYARAKPQDTSGTYSIEVAVHPLSDSVMETARALEAALATLIRPLKTLQALLQSRLEEEDAEQANAEGSSEEEEAIPGTLTADQRRRIGGIANAIRQRALEPTSFYKEMLAGLGGEVPEGFIDWLEVTRVEGKDLDVGYFRKFVDPAKVLMTMLGNQAQGALITSATLTDQTGVAEVDWSEAEAQTGTRHLPIAPTRLKLSSPYDYGTQSRVFVVQDLERDKPGQAANAMAKLFQASGGGGLGLFTSIQRLRQAYGRMAPRLEAADLNLLAQHVDAMDVTTLIDIFRADARACMLGTDALRDGVDVPGESLKLLAFERVPWPRPTLPHRARRAHFGPRTYDDRLTRLKLRQAFGRLIRRREDRGVFVMLDSRLPTRLESAFPKGVVVERLSLKEVLAAVQIFFA